MDYTQNLNLPQFGETDRIHHDDFNDAFAAIDAAMPRIAVGTYTGTGECGSSHPNTLTFDFPPKIVIIKRKAHDSMPTIIFCADTQAQSYGTPSSGGDLTVSTSGNSVSWFHNGGHWAPSTTGGSSPDATLQLNDAAEYLYFAIG